MSSASWWCCSHHTSLAQPRGQCSWQQLSNKLAPTPTSLPVKVRGQCCRLRHQASVTARHDAGNLGWGFSSQCRGAPAENAHDKNPLAKELFPGVRIRTQSSVGRRRCIGGAAAATADLDSYRAEDFEILQPVGRLRVNETWSLSREDELEESESSDDEVEELSIEAPSFINVYAARFATGKPLGMKDERVYLKEYTPAARELAMHEIKVYERLQDTGLGNAIGMTDTGELPVPKLVGRFVAGGLDSAWGPDSADDEFDIRGVVVQDRDGRQYYVEMEEPDDMSTDDDSDEERGRKAAETRPLNQDIDLAKLGRRRELEGFGSASQGSMFLGADGKVTDKYEEGNVSLETAEGEGARLWLVFEFEGMCTMEDFPGIEQSPNVVDFFRRGAAQERLTRFVKAVIRGAVEAVAFCHVRGVVHNAIAGSCFLLNSYEAKDWDKLRVKLSNFGFASDLSMGVESLDKEIVEMCRSLGADSPMAIAAMCRQHDIRMLGLAIAEFTFGTLGKSDVLADAASIQRLWDGVYELNMDTIRDYYLEDEDFKDVVEFLDAGEKAGWELLETLLSRTGIEADKVLSEARFFNPPGGWKLSR